MANYIGISTEYRDAQVRYMNNLRNKLKCIEGADVADCEDATLLEKSLQVITIVNQINVTVC